MSSLENGLAILKLLARDRPTLRVSEVARALGLPKASASRLLRALAEAGMLERDETLGHYIPGARLLELGMLFLDRRPLLARADQALAALIQRFGFTGYISALTGGEIALLRVAQGSYPLRYVRPVGARLPSWQTAMGHALLARLDDDMVRSRLQAAPPGETDRVLAALPAIRQTGVAQTPSVLMPGITTISVVLRDVTGTEDLALAVSFPDAAADDAARSDMIAWLRAASEEIGAPA